MFDLSVVDLGVTTTGGQPLGNSSLVNYLLLRHSVRDVGLSCFYIMSSCLTLDGAMKDVIMSGQQILTT